MTSCRIRLTQRLTVVALCIAGSITAGCGGDQDPDSSLPDDRRNKSGSVEIEQRLREPDQRDIPTDYAGSRACASCHREVYDSYQSHPMAQSLAAVGDAERIETAQPSDIAPEESREHYRVDQDGNTFRHHEIILDAAGKSVIEQSVPIHYSVGSGHHGRSYLFKRSGVMFMSPVSWYSEGRRWDLSPGYPANGHDRFERRVSSACLACHAGIVRPDPERSDTFQPEPFFEAAIGCERCHGPAGSHVAFHERSNSSAKPATDPILRLSELGRSRREAICNQCHLQGERRVLRAGRSEFDFRPGDRLDDVWVQFLKDQRLSDSDSVPAVSQVEQMMASKCYQNTKGRLGCISCHDPHSVPMPEARVTHFRSRCLQCHGESDSECAESPRDRVTRQPDDSCIACHMPRTSISDVSHSSQVDHRVLRHRPRGEIAKPVASTGRVVVFPESHAYLSDAEIDRAIALRTIRQAKDEGNKSLARLALTGLQVSVRQFQNDAAVHDAIAVAAHMTGDVDLARRSWRRTVEIDSFNESAVDGLGVLAFSDGRFDDALKWTKRLFEVNPARRDVYSRMARIHLSLKNTAAAEEWVMSGLGIDPGFAMLHSIRAEIAEANGNEQLAIRHKDIARRLLNR